MRPLIALTLALSHFPVPITAYPGLSQTLAEIQARAATASSPNQLQDRSISLLGDLISAILTPIGRTIADILTDKLPAIVAPDAPYKAPGPLGSDACNRDKLCVWKYISDDLAGTFAGCSSLARAAIRLGFHDAAAWDTSSSYGGADGSIVLSGNTGELGRFENSGLSPISAHVKTLYDDYGARSPKAKPGMADLIQLAANVATVVCPGGPRIRTLAGRKDSSQAAPTGKLPSPFDTAETLIATFRAKTFTPADLVALLGAHSVSRQSFFDPSRAGVPQDTTPSTWDMKYYADTTSFDMNSTQVVVFPSDRNIATYAGTRDAWNRFAGDGAQGRWAAAYASAWFRMSVLGVKNLNDLYDITRVLPQPR